MVISKIFNMGGSRYNVIKWVWPSRKYTNIVTHGDVMAKFDDDITIAT